MKKKTLTARDQVMLAILTGMLAQYGTEDNNPENITACVEDCYKMADLAGKVIDKA